MSVPSKIFTGYRALGFVSNHVPLAIRNHQKHKENYVVTCVGKAFHTYNCSRLGIISVSDAHPDDISCLAVDAYLVFTACGNVIQAFTRGRQAVHVYEGHEKEVCLLLPFGDHLISVDVESSVKVWDIKSEGVYVEMDFDSEGFQITALMHPSTYLNKILLGSKQGALQLWNIKTNKFIYAFPGWGASVTTLEQAPAMDVVAIGLSDGQIIVHNIKFDESIVKFRQDWGPVTAISFRTDGHPIMVTGSAAGHIALWDLEEKKLRSQIREAHFTSVTGMQCLPSEPLMVTSAADNTLKVWIFDIPDGGGRLLRQRAGHSAPPTRLRHYGDNGQNILSAGQDSTLRSFSVIHDKHNKSLGRASLNKTETKKSGLKYDEHKMPPITEFVAELSRQSDWDNIVACHRGTRLVTTWSFQRSTMGQHKLESDRFKENEVEFKQVTAQAIDISPCGNFAVIGYSSGHVDMYNLQSGIHRGSYGSPKAHNCGVRGVAIDSLNQVTVTAGADGCLKFWKFKQKNLLETEKLDVAISHILLHRESSMLAIAKDDFTVDIVDMDTRRVVRSFTGHRNQVTDMTFSSDARWLITASMDSLVRTWDLPSGNLVDCFELDAAVTSLTMSPTGDFLVTSHVDDVGIYLWSNMTLYTHVPLRPLPLDYVPQTMAMPSTSHTRKGITTDDKETEPEEEEVTTFKSPEQLSNELITLSLLPNSRWQNLLNLDIIRERNKPKQPVKIPKSAPFFLPTLAGLEPKFISADDDIPTEKIVSRVIVGNMQTLSELGKRLDKSAASGNYDEIIKFIKELGPSAIDTEIRCLAPEGGGSVPTMCQFVEFIDHVLGTRKDFELAQAYLGLFLKVHGELIVSEPDLTKQVEQLAERQASSWRDLQGLFTQSLCLINYLRSATL